MEQEKGVTIIECPLGAASRAFQGADFVLFFPCFLCASTVISALNPQSQTSSKVSVFSSVGCKLNSGMSPHAKFLFVSMCTAFGLCIAGLVAGMAYNLFLVLAHHHSLESVLGHSIPFFKFLGALGILGFLLFLAFLVSAISGKNKGENPK